MTVLLLGGTGKTSSRIARLLEKANIPVLLASRSGTGPAPFQSCHFDWFNPSTYNNPFTKVAGITAVYLIPPFTLNVFTPMKSFTELARRNGVQRFVFLSGSILSDGDLATRQFHEYLTGLGVDYAIISPTWFMENFSEVNVALIRDKDMICSATRDGKIPWVSVDDIAMVAYRALVDEPSHNTEHLVLGPELLSYDDVAEILTKALGRRISHVRISEEEVASDLQSAGGLELGYARMLAALDTAVANGIEQRLNDKVWQITGRSPKAFKEFVEANKAVWT